MCLIRSIITHLADMLWLAYSPPHCCWSRNPHLSAACASPPPRAGAAGTDLHSTRARCLRASALRQPAPRRPSPTFRVWYVSPTAACCEPCTAGPESEPGPELECSSPRRLREMIIRLPMPPLFPTTTRTARWRRETAAMWEARWTAPRQRREIERNHKGIMGKRTSPACATLVRHTGRFHLSGAVFQTPGVLKSPMFD